MTFQISEEFDRQFKRLFKKYKSLIADLLQLKQELQLMLVSIIQTLSGQLKLTHNTVAVL
jgi:hypothetical protein